MRTHIYYHRSKPTRWLRSADWRGTTLGGGPGLRHGPAAVTDLCLLQSFRGCAPGDAAPVRTSSLDSWAVAAIYVAEEKVAGGTVIRAPY